MAVYTQTADFQNPAVPYQICEVKSTISERLNERETQAGNTVSFHFLIYLIIILINYKGYRLLLKPNVTLD